jgi:hypothetical protein
MTDKKEKIKWIDERSWDDPDHDFFSYAQGSNWYISVYCGEDDKPRWEVQLGKELDIVESGKSYSTSSAKIDVVVALKFLLAKMSSEVDELIVQELKK